MPMKRSSAALKFLYLALLPYVLAVLAYRAILHESWILSLIGPPLVFVVGGGIYIAYRYRMSRR